MLNSEEKHYHLAKKSMIRSSLIPISYYIPLISPLFLVFISFTPYVKIKNRWSYPIYIIPYCHITPCLSHFFPYIPLFDGQNPELLRLGSASSSSGNSARRKGGTLARAWWKSQEILTNSWRKLLKISCLIYIYTSGWIYIYICVYIYIYMWQIYMYDYVCVYVCIYINMCMSINTI